MYVLTWLTVCRDSFFSSLTDEDREDSRFKISPQLSDSDRQLLFADFVIELQAAEDDKRRRIRDARRRAEKAQREAYRDVLRRLAVDGLIRPYTQWRSVEDVIAVNDAFNPIQAQDRDAPREIFEEFVEEWVDVYRRERAFLSRLVNSPENDNAIKPETSHDDFAKLLLRMAESSSQDILVDTRRIINRDEPVSAARIYLEELLSMAKDSSQRKGTQRRAVQDESSEDEGEIIEEGEADVNDMPETGNDKKDGYIRNEQSPADVANTAGIATIDSTSNAIDGTAGGNESNGEPSGAGLDTSDS